MTGLRKQLDHLGKTYHSVTLVDASPHGQLEEAADHRSRRRRAWGSSLGQPAATVLVPAQTTLSTRHCDRVTDRWCVRFGMKQGRSHRCTDGQVAGHFEACRHARPRTPGSEVRRHRQPSDPCRSGSGVRHPASWRRTDRQRDRRHSRAPSAAPAMPGPSSHARRGGVSRRPTQVRTQAPRGSFAGPLSWSTPPRSREGTRAPIGQPSRPVGRSPVVGPEADPPPPHDVRAATNISAHDHHPPAGACSGARF